MWAKKKKNWRKRESEKWEIGAFPKFIIFFFYKQSAVPRPTCYDDDGANNEVAVALEAKLADAHHRLVPYRMPMLPSYLLLLKVLIALWRISDDRSNFFSEQKPTRACFFNKCVFDDDSLQFCWIECFVWVILCCLFYFFFYLHFNQRIKEISVWITIIQLLITRHGLQLTFGACSRSHWEAKEVCELKKTCWERERERERERESARPQHPSRIFFG